MKVSLHNTHAHSAEADVATASSQQSTVTATYGERLVMGGPFAQSSSRRFNAAIIGAERAGVSF